MQICHLGRDVVAWCLPMMLAIAPPSARGGQTLYNGIVLPDQWPPRYRALSREEPMPVPWLQSPPRVIPIDVGRQLFVDDFLIEQTTLRRTLHKARYHPRNPVLRPETPWEHGGQTDSPSGTAAAMVFGGGVWFDPADRLFIQHVAAERDIGAPEDQGTRRRFQPGRLPLASTVSRAHHRGVRRPARLERGQHPVGRRLLPGGR